MIKGYYLGENFYTDIYQMPRPNRYAARQAAVIVLLAASRARGQACLVFIAKSLYKCAAAGFH